MKRLAILATLFPAAASAHPGHHLYESASALLAHLMSEPDHAALLAGTGLAIVWLIVFLRERRRRHE